MADGEIKHHVYFKINMVFIFRQKNSREFAAVL